VPARGRRTAPDGASERSGEHSFVEKRRLSRRLGVASNPSYRRRRRRRRHQRWRKSSQDGTRCRRQEFDRRRFWRCCCFLRRSRTEEFAAEQSLRITSSTTQQSNDRSRYVTGSLQRPVPRLCRGTGLSRSSLSFSYDEANHRYQQPTVPRVIESSMRFDEPSIRLDTGEQRASRHRQLNRRGVWRCCCFLFCRNRWQQQFVLRSRYVARTLA
jgi:hypothetical protein